MVNAYFTLDKVLLAVSLFLIGLGVRYYEDLRKQKSLNKEFHRFFNNFWKCISVGCLLLGLLIGIWVSVPKKESPKEIIYIKSDSSNALTSQPKK